MSRIFHGSSTAASRRLSKIWAIEQMIKEIDFYQPQLKSRALPADADLYHRQILKLILDDYDSGRLQEYCSDLAIGSAVESYKDLQEFSKQITADDKNDDHSRLEQDLERAIYEIKDIKELVKNATPERQKTFFAQTGSSQFCLDALHKTIALTLAHEAIKNGEPVPQYVSGHTSDYCYQYSLGELSAAGVDMGSKATYEIIGMD